MTLNIFHITVYEKFLKFSGPNATTLLLDIVKHNIIKMDHTIGLGWSHDDMHEQIQHHYFRREILPPLITILLHQNLCFTVTTFYHLEHPIKQFEKWNPPEDQE